MIRLPLLLSLALAVGAVSSPVAAEGPDGIGFAQAEEGTWWCRGGDADATLACARAKCTDESGGQECFATRWCFPAGWSGLMVAWLPEFHSTHVVCGMPGEAATRAALRAICEKTPEFTRCDLVRLIDPDGTEQEVDESIEPYGAAE
ncbi:MAG: hypothetical protein KDJ88_03145 [Bauldia sp.]|nr:hypothetical protein [Bauldia sp.]